MPRLAQKFWAILLPLMMLFSNGASAQAPDPFDWVTQNCVDLFDIRQIGNTCTYTLDIQTVVGIGNFSLTINWGDGATSFYPAFSNAIFISHTYSSQSNGTISYVITDVATTQQYTCNIDFYPSCFVTYDLTYSSCGGVRFCGNGFTVGAATDVHTWDFGDGFIVSGLADNPIPPLTNNGMTSGTYRNPCHFYSNFNTFNNVNTTPTVVYTTTIAGSDPIDFAINLETEPVPLPALGIYIGFRNFATPVSATTLLSQGVISTTIADPTFIWGRFDLDVPSFDFNFNQNTMMGGALIFGSGQSLGGVNLTLRSSTFSGCSSIWRGIWLRDNSFVTTLGGGVGGTRTLIRDAEFALRVANNCNINISDTHFRQNFIGIEGSVTTTLAPSIALPMSAVTQATQKNLISSFSGDVLFQCNVPGTALTEGLFQPYTNQIGYNNFATAGIRLSKINTFLLNPTVGANNLVRFIGLGNGILATDVGLLNVSQSSFVNMGYPPNSTQLNVGGAKGIGIFLNNLTLSTATLIQVGLGSGNPIPTFDVCNSAIGANRSIMDIRNNNMNLVFNGIRGNDFVGIAGNIFIVNNRMNNVRRGIELFGLNTPNFRIDNNDIIVGTISLANNFNMSLTALQNQPRVGITCGATVGVPKTSKTIINNRITLNTAENNSNLTTVTHNGIAVENMPTIGLVRNRVTFQSNTTARMTTGIGVVNSDDAALYCNSVVGPNNFATLFQLNQPNALCDGIVCSSLGNNGILQCNDVDRSRTAYAFSGINNGTDLRGNAIWQYNVGMNFFNGSIGAQIDRGNIWLGQFVNIPANPGSSINGGVQNLFDVSGQGSSLWPSTPLANPATTFSNLSTNITYSCGNVVGADSCGTGVPTFAGEGEEEVLITATEAMDLFVAQQNPVVPEGQQFITEMLLLEALTASPLSYNTLIENFETTESSSVLGQLLVQRDAMKDLNSFDATQQQQVDLFYQSITEGLAEIEQQNLSLALASNGQDSAAILAQIDFLNLQVNMEQEALQSFMLNEQNQASGLAAAVKADNNLIATTTDPQLADQLIRDVSLTPWLSEDGAYFNEEQRSLIDIIAESCPQDLGDAVNFARALRKLYFTKDTYLDADCGNTTNALVQYKKPNIAVAQLLLSPNPAFDMALLRWSNIDTDGEATIIMSDITGGTIWSASFPQEKNGLMPIPVKDVANGIYFVSVRNKQVVLATAKLVIQH